MINKRLVWYLESNNLLTKFQSGFRAERSTNDNLVRPETFIRDAFIKLEHVVAVFFEFEKNLRYYLAIWNAERPTQLWSERKTTKLY